MNGCCQKVCWQISDYKGNRFSKRVNKLLHCQTALLQHALESFWRDAFVVWNRDLAKTLDHTDVGTHLPHSFKAEPFEGFDGIAAGYIAWQLHAVASIGSLRK